MTADVTLTARLAQSDFLRFPTQLAIRDLPFKEWHHFVIQLPEVRLLVNFSLSMDEQPDGTRRFAPRILVISHGDVEASIHHRANPEEAQIDPSLCQVQIGTSFVRLGEDGYQIGLDLQEHDLSATIVLQPTSRPFVVNNQPVASGRLSWLFVPELVASGTIHLCGKTLDFAGAVAYHDHNWGHFRWGDDFSWMWGSVLPNQPGDLSIVAMRMTDRAGHHTHAQALYAWRDGKPVAIFRDAQITIRRSGTMEGHASSYLPSIIRTLTSDSTDVPAALDIVGTDKKNRIALSFSPNEYSRIGLADERSVDRIVTLDEATGPVAISTRIDGNPNGCFGSQRGFGVMVWSSDQSGRPA